MAPQKDSRGAEDEGRPTSKRLLASRFEGETGVMSRDATYWIESLQLARHPEGGYFKRTYEAREGIDKEHLPERFRGHRLFSTAIYYLLPGHEVSCFHRLKADEIWHFYTGSALTLYVIDHSGALLQRKLGTDHERGEVFQAPVHGGCWFGAVVDDPASYSLVGCTVSPGFDYEDFELGDRKSLLASYPEHRWIIERLTLQG